MNRLVVSAAENIAAEYLLHGEDVAAEVTGRSAGRVRKESQLVVRASAQHKATVE